MDQADSEYYHILVIDDEPSILRLVKATLEPAGFHVSTAASGEEALQLIQRSGLPHLALVDINMPYGMSGLEFAEKILSYSDLPLIMLTAVDDDQTRIESIERFAEDYITKPFVGGELVARVRRILRRIGDFAYVLSPEINVDDHLQVSFAEKSINLGGRTVPLTPTETKLLYILMRHAGRTLPSDFIMRRLWPLDTAGDERLRVYVHRLRRKLATVPARRDYIQSERGVGYYFDRTASGPGVQSRPL